MSDIEEGWSNVGSAYDLLHVNRNSPEIDDESIQEAFDDGVRLASDEEEERHIREAFETLRTEPRRNAYNLALNLGRSRTSSNASDTCSVSTGTSEASTTGAISQGGTSEFLLDLLQATSKLRATYKLQLPQIVVCGMESEGKSSTLERIAMRNVLPRDREFCTRLPVRLMMRNSSHQNEVAIRLKNTETGSITRECAPHYCETSDQTDEPIARQVANIIRTFIKEQRTDDDKFSVITDHEVQVEIRAPNVPTIDLVDLPGIVTAPENSKRATEKITRQLLNAPHTIVLAVVSGTICRLQSHGIWPFLRETNKPTIVALTMVDVPSGDVGFVGRVTMEGQEIPSDVSITSIIPLVNRDSSCERASDQRTLQNSVAHERDVLIAKCQEHGIEFDESRYGIVALLRSINDALQEYMRKTWVTDELERTRGVLQGLFSDLWKLGTKPSKVLLPALKEELETGLDELLNLSTDAWVDAKPTDLRPIKQILLPQAALGNSAPLLRRTASVWQSRREIGAQVPNLVDTIWNHFCIQFEKQVFGTSELPLRLLRFENLVSRTRETLKTFLETSRAEIEKTLIVQLMDALKEELSSRSDEIDMDHIQKRLWFQASAVILRETFAHPELIEAILEELELCFNDGLRESQDIANERQSLEEKVDAVYVALSDVQRTSKVDNDICNCFRRARCFSDGGPTETVQSEELSNDDLFWLFAPSEHLLSAFESRGHCRFIPQERWDDESFCNEVIRCNLPMIKGVPVRSVLRVMDNHPKDADVQRHACGALCSLARRTDNKNTLPQQGAAERILRAMDNHKKNPDVQERACEALRDLAVRTESKKALMKQGAPEMILQAMDNHRSIADVQKYACGALYNLASRTENRKTLVEHGAVERILKAMDNHKNVSDVQEKACGVLRNLAVGAECKKTLMKKGAAERILQAMDNHKRNADVQARACGALGNLAVRAKAQVTLVEQGAAERILEAMDNHQNNPDVQKYACGALYNLTFRDENKKTLMEQGAAVWVLQAMGNHQSSPDVQKYACGALYNLAFRDENKKILMEQGTAERVLQVMDNQQNNADVLKYACGVLYNLASRAKNKRALIEQGAVERILHAMDSHQNNADVQERACAALVSLAVREEDQETLVEQGAAEMLLKAMDNHQYNANVQKYASAALYNLSLRTENQETLMERGTSERILQAMENHQNDAGFQENACGVLLNLAQRAVHRETLKRQGTAERILQAMDKHKSNAKVQKNACGALWNLTLRAGDKETLMEQGMIERILQAMDSHQNDAEIQERACGVLRNLALRAENKVNLISQGAPERILQAMDNHYNNADVQKRACGVLWDLAERAENQEILMKKGASVRILRVMEKHRNDPDVQENACGALFNLAERAENKETLMVQNSAERILQAMDNHPKNADVQQNACEALWNLAERAANRENLMRQGTTERILQAMDNHKSNGDIQKKACGVLWNLLGRTENKETVMEQHAVERVLQAMENHANNADVQNYACRVLQYLARRTETRENLKERGVEERIRRVISKHNADLSIYFDANFALMKLSDDENL